VFDSKDFLMRSEFKLLKPRERRPYCWKWKRQDFLPFELFEKVSPLCGWTLFRVYGDFAARLCQRTQNRHRSGLAGVHAALVPQGTLSSGITTPEFTLSAIIHQGARRSAASGGCSDARVGGVRGEPAGGAANPYGTRPARVLPLDNPRSMVF